jgi:hypothetical protein
MKAMATADVDCFGRLQVNNELEPRLAFILPICTATFASMQNEHAAPDYVSIKNTRAIAAEKPHP